MIFNIWTEDVEFNLADKASLTLSLTNCDVKFYNIDLDDQASVSYNISNHKYFKSTKFNADKSIKSIKLVQPENRNSYQCFVELRLPESYIMESLIIECSYECRIYQMEDHTDLITINYFKIRENKTDSYAGVYFNNLKVVTHAFNVMRAFIDIENLQLQSDSNVKLDIKKGHIELNVEDDAEVSWVIPKNNLCFDSPAISGFQD